MPKEVYKISEIFEPWFLKIIENIWKRHIFSISSAIKIRIDETYLLDIVNEVCLRLIEWEKDQYSFDEIEKIIKEVSMQISYECKILLSGQWHDEWSGLKWLVEDSQEFGNKIEGRIEESISPWIDQEDDIRERKDIFNEKKGYWIL